ncbi:MAG TPA: hypothetical protein VGQ13_03400 [Nitrososphaera sp.]|nr:hypothetical protein [Nitrososphaera sp.]
MSHFVSLDSKAAYSGAIIALVVGVLAIQVEVQKSTDKSVVSNKEIEIELNESDVVLSMF